MLKINFVTVKAEQPLDIVDWLLMINYQQKQNKSMIYNQTLISYWEKYIPDPKFLNERYWHMLIDV